ncbi:MAG: ankyrin repeat domain-containing protein [Verrucomicrobiota bacterium]|jgi:ankyrin repeat protein|nr:ankyrin repeat domain-containing protein [Verrucomicrobiota bacterium]
MNIDYIFGFQFLRLASVAALIVTGCSGSKGSIHEAAIKADLAMVKRLVESGLDINHKDKKKVTALHITAYYGQASHIRVAKWMLANGADVSLEDYKGNTPLDVAESRGNKEIAKIIEEAASNSGTGRNQSNGGRNLIDGGTGVSEVINF